MSLFRLFRVAVTALGANKLRSMLAVLGIATGISAVIMMVGMGQGAQAKAEESIGKMGVNLVFVYPRMVARGASGAKTSQAETLTLEDAEAVALLPHVTAVAPEVRRFYQVKVLSRNEQAMVVGSTPRQVDVRDSRVEKGAYFDEAAVTGRLQAAVLGSKIARKLFGNVDPVGRTMQIDRKEFHVLGVLEEKGGVNWGQHDDSVYVPVTTALHRLFNRRYLGNLTISIDDPGNTEEVVRQVEEELRRRHRIARDAEPDFALYTQEEIRRRMEETTGAFTRLLMGIAAVSLFVGGIGIMNIMLVSVTERTREIGIRKAIGARRVDILRQFLIESMSISLLGGLLGIALGLAGARLIPQLPVWQSLSNGGEWEAVVSPESVAVSFLFSCAVGIFFGIYPAMKASRLKPVEALRYE